MPGRPKNNDTKIKETEKPKGKKIRKHITIIKCSLCGNSRHNKAGCGANLEEGKKKYSHLIKIKKPSDVMSCLTAFIML
jgi:hypothetical protein